MPSKPRWRTKERLKQMALAAREHVKTHLTLRALASHIIETGLSFKRSGA